MLVTRINTQGKEINKQIFQIHIQKTLLQKNKDGIVYYFRQRLPSMAFSLSSPEPGNPLLFVDGI